MRRVVIFTALFVSLSLECSADFASTVFLKSTIFFKDSSSVGYIKLYEDNLKPIYRDLIAKEFKNSDSILFNVIKKLNRIDIHEYATEISMQIDEIPYNLKYVSEENIISIETKTIKKIEVLDYVIQDYHSDYYIRSLLTKKEFWQYSDIKNKYTISEWGYGGDCGGKVIDYSGSPDVLLIVDKLNLLRAEYYTVEKNIKKKKWDDWIKLFKKLSVFDSVIIVSQNCND